MGGEIMLKNKRNLGSQFSAVPVNSYNQIEDAYNLKLFFFYFTYSVVTRD